MFTPLPLSLQTCGTELLAILSTHLVVTGAAKPTLLRSFLSGNFPTELPDDNAAPVLRLPHLLRGKPANQDQ